MPKYDKNRKPLINAEIVRLRDTSSPQLSFEEIGVIFGISRQRTHHIYWGEKKKELGK